MHIWSKWIYYFAGKEFIRLLVFGMILVNRLVLRGKLSVKPLLSSHLSVRVIRVYLQISTLDLHWEWEKMKAAWFCRKQDAKSQQF
ncbi:MAG: hypothetical protein ACM3O8_01250 [Methylococcaceae bacterium]